MDEHLRELETCLRQLGEEHERLLGLVRRKAEAMRSAKPELIAETCERENAAVHRIAGLEKRRQAAVGAITERLAPAAAEPLRLADIADRTGEPRRGRLLVLHQKLRDTMSTIQRENAVARRATEGLLHHVRGIMQQVARTVGDPYARRGDAAAITGPAALRSFSVTG